MYEQSIGVVLAVLVTLAHRVCEHLVPIVLRLDAIVAVTLSRLRPLQEMDLCHVPAKSFVGEVIVTISNCVRGLPLPVAGHCLRNSRMSLGATLVVDPLALYLLLSPLDLLGSCFVSPSAS